MTMTRDADAINRIRRGFTGDCATLNAAAHQSGRSGIALLFDEDGNMEVVSLNGGANHLEVSKEGQHVTVEHNFEGWNYPKPNEKHKDDTRKIVEEAGAAYEQVSGENFIKAAANSHEPGNRTAGHFPPQVHAGATRPASDAARCAQMTADAKRFMQEQFARNERIAAAMKARSAQIHK